jgi:hypothetical protein
VAPVNVALDVNDTSASQTEIKVAKGAAVSITFKVSSSNGYHGGLDFRSPNLSTGTITPGNAKTVSFTADQSFTLVPYWPSSNIKKDYTVNIVVE